MRTSVDIFSNRKKLKRNETQLSDRKLMTQSKLKNVFASLRSFCLCASALTSLIICVSSCGKMGPPLPPLPRVPLIVSDLRAVQEGDSVNLSFPLTRGPKSTKLQRIDVFRLTEAAEAPLGITSNTFSDKASIIYSFTENKIPTDTATLVYKDTLDLKNTSNKIRYRYAVQLVDKDGVAADLSNYALVAPIFNLANPPKNLQVVQGEKEIQLSWDAPLSNMNGTSPANIIGYNVYRKAESGAFVKLNSEILNDTKFTDRNFSFGEIYEYAVRGLSSASGSTGKIASTNALETSAGNSQIIAAKDIFAPPPPSSVTIASIQGIVSIYWPLNTESDIAGYNIYRADSINGSADKWVKLNQNIHTTASFKDNNVKVEQEYFYKITAVDTSGNESQPSKVVSEKVAP